MALMVPGDGKGDWDFGDMRLCLSSGREKLRMILSNIQSLFSLAGRLAPDRGLDVSCLT